MQAIVQSCACNVLLLSIIHKSMNIPAEIKMFCQHLTKSVLDGRYIFIHLIQLPSQPYWKTRVLETSDKKQNITWENSFRLFSCTYSKHFIMHLGFPAFKNAHPAPSVLLLKHLHVSLFIYSFCLIHRGFSRFILNL